MNLIKGDDQSSVSSVYLEYRDENTFNVFNYDSAKDTKEPLLMDANIIVNPENGDELIIRTNDQQYKIPFLRDQDGVNHFFDQEGQPISFNVQSASQQGTGEEVMGNADFVKSPMPGTVVKCYVEVG